MNLKRRKELVLKVVKYEGEPSDYFDEIRSFGWDCDSALVTIKNSDVRNILNKYKTGDITAAKVTEWADFIETRDDIDMESKAHDEVIFWLANPEINYEINKELVQKINEALNKSVI